MSETGQPVEILLAEDNPGDAKLTQKAFEEGNILNNLHIVENGVEAMDFLKQRGDYEDKARPDLVLLDLNMPKKDGWDVLEEINDDPELRRIPVIVLTSSEAESDIVKSYELQANAYLSKPVDYSGFMDVVRSLEEFWLSVVKMPPK
ncbi:response regulator receiver protein [Halorhabdus utahensis DSM 12940]|uniref:Response regulator receiver protein n=1 Tax=Halorhabdus utahensis (strain DSM 12940 / JCM 11049 / AX-2) TaxID=519442 RepID=C7NSF2_HALUD|nr:response regulator [Halorhabdus utahensis]ACV12039.1 response regulator receiver protein [Halorhabdus utahensis DSM 12940]